MFDAYLYNQVFACKKIRELPDLTSASSASKERSDTMATAAHRLTGLSVARTNGPITTFNQLGGGGTVVNNALAIPVHLGGAWNSIEYVQVSPVTKGEVSSVGEHVQGTDEIYFIHRGTGLLTTNGAICSVGPGFLVIAP